MIFRVSEDPGLKLGLSLKTGNPFHSEGLVVSAGRE
jgi:hypothetical protein